MKQSFFISLFFLFLMSSCQNRKLEWKIGYEEGQKCRNEN